MCVLVKGELRKIIDAKTAKGKSFRKLSVLVDHGRYEEIIKIDDFSDKKISIGDVELPVIPSSYLAKSGYHGINYKIVG